MAKKNLPDYDVAIVGGGVSGIYTAWRMITDGMKQSPQLKEWAKKRGKIKIAVFEGAERTGGRIHTAKSPALPDLPVEIGGMRYSSDHNYVRSLVENKFKLPTHPQIVDVPTNLLYVRGKQLKTSDEKSASKLPYNLSAKEKKYLSNSSPNDTAQDLIEYAVYNLFPEIQKKQLSGTALRNYLKKQKVQNVPVYQWGFWNLIATQLTHEAYELAVTTIGYDCLGYNTNALDTIVENLGFTASSTYSLLNNGYEEIVYIMEQEFLSAGGAVETNHWLQSFDSAPLPGKTTGVELKFKTGKKSKKVSARCIILAMPRHSMELLEESGPVMDPLRAPEFRRMMHAVEPIHLYKMYLVYETPWWKKLGLNNGRSVTDIPVRQCYYWGVDPKTKHGILMLYNDAVNADFWGGFRIGQLDQDASIKNITWSRKKTKNDVNTQKMTGYQKMLFDNWNCCKTPKRMMMEMHRQVKEMHGNVSIPDPIDAAFIDWGDAPYGGAVHFWNPGWNSDEIMPAMTKPVKNFPCYTCGESYSQVQTWVEGALDTAELILQNQFKLKRPDWYTASPTPTKLQPSKKVAVKKRKS